MFQFFTLNVEKSLVGSRVEAVKRGLEGIEFIACRSVKFEICQLPFQIRLSRFQFNKALIDSIEPFIVSVKPFIVVFVLGFKHPLNAHQNGIGSFVD